MDWIYLAEAREEFRGLVSAVINLRVPKIARNILTS